MLRLVICTHCGKEICYIGGEVKNEPPMLGECFNCRPIKKGRRVVDDRVVDDRVVMVGSSTTPRR